ncbi:MAG: sulfite exporter TauE/SafE family protein [Deltaproteobacteria bacterium HGW-Deltaproteobacteria-18]|jgi:hypothetical protein|nr:MAG: sulfite exporter TauE/SafE family protein [Deltaproteobacteria bacterium HGW-Deltaproteobacteria-18]
MDSTLYLITMCGWLLGGFVNGIVGFGAALVAMPIVASGLDMPLAVSTCGLVVLSLNLQMAWNYRSELDSSGIKAVILGGIPGAFCGLLILKNIPESGLKIGLGALLVVYSLWGLSGTQVNKRKLATSWGMLAGFLSTGLGTAFGFNGPPLAVYLSLRGGTQQQIKAALGAFFIVSGLFIVAAHALSGLYSAQTFWLVAAALPAVWLGAWGGIRVSGRLKDLSFQRVLFIMILIMGLNMAWKALPIA